MPCRVAHRHDAVEPPTLRANGQTPQNLPGWFDGTHSRHGYTNQIEWLVDCFSAKGHESEWFLAARFDPTGQSVDPIDPGKGANRTTLNDGQTENYDPRCQFPNKPILAHRLPRRQTKLPPGHAPLSSKLHGKPLLQCRREPATLPPNRRQFEPWHKSPKLWLV